VVLAGVFAFGKHAQIGQPVVVLVAVDVMDFFIGSEAAAEFSGNDKPVFIDPAPVVCHRQEGAVERHHDGTVAIGLDMETAAPSWMALAARPAVGLGGHSMFRSARMAAKAYRLALSDLDGANLAAVQACPILVSCHIDILPYRVMPVA
jgi:hypothetical protein